jgi:hypothetical protein
MARMMIAALMSAGTNTIIPSTADAEPLRDAGKPRRLRKIAADTYDWFGPKGSTGNKYKPHQGKKEIARRLSKMKCGKVNSGHTCTMPKGSECPDCCGIRGETIGEGD